MRTSWDGTWSPPKYLGWVEILRRDIGFLDLGDQRRNRRLVELLSVIRRVLFATDLDAIFHVPTGHQRAVGELMIAADHAGTRTLHRIRDIL